MILAREAGSSRETAYKLLRQVKADTEPDDQLASDRSEDLRLA